ncbi:lutropin-choriogonadotropic hormone receptor-like isoform X2 [Cylas formicarius]|nr:lutropin-choriogonadotropic hormone receptor-like isoform X2 [Cylas formicarius]
MLESLQICYGGKMLYQPISSDLTQHCICEDVSIEDHLCHCQGQDFNDIPRNLPNNISILSVQNAGLEVLKSNSLVEYADTLHELNLENLEQFYHIETGVFHNLKQLQTLYIYMAPKLRKILPEVFNASLPNLKVVRIVYTGLEHVPDFNGLNTNSVLHMIDLDHNGIKKITKEEIRNLAVSQLILSYNDLRVVEAQAFSGSQVAYLSLRGNTNLEFLHGRAFHKLQNLRRLDLSGTAITALPTDGLQEVDVLKIEDTYSLKIFPSVFNFKYIKEAWLTYPYHCCAFKYPGTHDPNEFKKQTSAFKKLRDECNKNTSIVSWKVLESESPRLYVENNEVWGDEMGVFHNVARKVSVEPHCDNEGIRDFQEVRCIPIPDPFNPCEDLMGNWGLRIPVWIISHSAVIGNLLVLVVICTSHFRLTVSKFLMCNLSIADLCIGIHLMLLAGIDAHSMGAYFNFAIDWQEGSGCKIAGFLTVFGNVLSVFTLAVITVERWCTITWAAHLNKRLKLRTCIKLMLFGWICATFMAVLPLTGISNYSRTSICLPLESKNRIDSIYLGVLLAFNCAAFTLICICYGSMYRTIIAASRTGLTSSVRNDQTVAKKMALLVFTDFACWSPIAFFGTTALLGYPLITVTQTKILLVFIYPLNSCANPCLYALLTQQYRKDFFLFLGKLGLCTEHAESKRGAIRGKPLPYTAQFKKIGETTTSNKSSSGFNANRSSLITTVTTLTVEIPLRTASMKNPETIDYVSSENL